MHISYLVYLETLSSKHKSCLGEICIAEIFSLIINYLLNSVGTKTLKLLGLVLAAPLGQSQRR